MTAPAASPPRSRASAIPELRAVGHHLARAAGRARRAEAGAAPHPLHDVAAEPHRRRQASQVREGRRRRDGQLPPARRRGDLRDARPHGAVVLAARAAHRRLRQLRLARRRRRGGDALHGVPPRARGRRDPAGDRTADGAVPAQLRRHAHRAGGPAVAHSESARQRRDRHRRRHGDEHPAAQPQRGVHRAHQAARQPGADERAAVPLHQGPGLSDRRARAELAGGAQGDLQDRPGHVRVCAPRGRTGRRRAAARSSTSRAFPTRSTSRSSSSASATSS